MILNGKAKEDFKEWVFENYYFQDLNILYPLHLVDALIIEWFDSVGIYIDAEFFRKNIKDEPQFVSFTTDEWNGLQSLRVEFNSRKEATIQAIKKANDIYNVRYSKQKQTKC